MKYERSFRSGFFNLRVVLGLVLGLVGVLLALIGFGMSSGGSLLAQDPRQDGERGGRPQTATDPLAPGVKITPDVLADTTEGKSASVVIFLADQADLSAAYGMSDHDARGWFVYNTLTQHAARTQVGLQAFLAARGAKYQSFWAANMIIATVDRSLAESLAARVDVARIDANKPARWIENPEVANYEVTPTSPTVVNAVEWGVSNVNAPAVWAMGFTGQGMVVGDLDTGVRWTHNALKPKYRGWNGAIADHNFNWHDAIHLGGGVCGPNTVAPCDDDTSNTHGTHTTGTTVGDDGSGNQVGVAPGAKWIACRNMNQGNGTPATYTECFQFMIAPTDLAGNNANPALRPHVLNNSWGCPASEGCVNRSELETIIGNTQAAGIFVEASAGNSGPGCSSVTDAPAIYSASFSTGAIDISNVLASFSSRGPSTFYTPNLLKPNVSAPGVNVRSSSGSGDNLYRNLSGTSMAGPHVVGVVALLWSAHPELVRDIAATKTILQNTANPGVTLTPTQTCGGTPSTQVPNNSFGYGRVDALAAVNAVATPIPTPTPANTPSPTLTPTNTPTNTPTLTPTATATPLVSVSGVVTYCSNPSPNPVSNVVLHLTGDATTSTLSDGSGNYQFSSLAAGGNYTVTPAKADLAPGSAGINTVDVVAVQKHFLVIGTPLFGCQLAAADVNNAGGINTVDVIAIQKFFLVIPGAAGVGQYQFTPANRSYVGLASDQTAQDFDALILGDVIGPFAERAGGPTEDAAEVSATVASVALPEVAANQDDFIAAVRTTAIDAKNKLIGFQGDFTFDGRVVRFQSEPVQKAGITGGNWNVSGNVLPGRGPIRTLRISAYSNDFTPLSGSGTLFELRMARVSKGNQSTQLLWALPPDQFIFIDADLKTQKPGDAKPGRAWTQQRNDASVEAKEALGALAFLLASGRRM